MELATADAVQPREGEAAFILQLRPPATAHADALAWELERFTSLYLERATAEHVRFTPLGALTWALCAPVESVEEVDSACDELASTLFGDPASEAVHLARQPEHPRQEDYRIQNQSLSDEEGESVMEDLAEHEWDFAVSEESDSGSDSEPDAAELPAAASAIDEDEDSIDLDDFVPPADAQDDWELDSPLDVEPMAALEAEPEESASDAEDDASVDEDAPEPEMSGDEEAGLSAFDAYEAQADADELTDTDTDAADPEDFSPDEDVDFDAALEADAPETPEIEALEDETLEAGMADVADDGLDETPVDALDIEVELEDFVEEGDDKRPAQPGIWDEDVDTVDIDDIAASALHETRLGTNLDVAAELNAFREEMRAIARSIPTGGLDATLSDFRAGLESLSGELGQRVDGAAQRIEAAVGQLDVDRYDAASHRVESAASLMETSIHEALEALKRAGAAMSSPAASDMFDAQEQDSL